jgi:hypothetical protein
LFVAAVLALCLGSTTLPQLKRASTESGTVFEPGIEKALEKAIKDHYRILNVWFEKNAEIVKSVPNQFKTSKAFVSANLSQADLAFGRGDLALVLAHIEASLTAIHDLVDALAATLTEPVHEVENQ